MAIWRSPGAHKSDHMGRAVIEGTCERVELGKDDLLAIGVDADEVADFKQDTANGGDDDH